MKQFDYCCRSRQKYFAKELDVAVSRMLSTEETLANLRRDLVRLLPSHAQAVATISYGKVSMGLMDPASVAAAAATAAAVSLRPVF